MSVEKFHLGLQMRMEKTCLGPQMSVEKTCLGPQMRVEKTCLGPQMSVKKIREAMRCRLYFTEFETYKIAGKLSILLLYGNQTCFRMIKHNRKLVREYK